MSSAMAAAPMGITSLARVASERRSLRPPPSAGALACQTHRQLHITAAMRHDVSPSRADFDAAGREGPIPISSSCTGRFEAVLAPGSVTRRQMMGGVASFIALVASGRADAEISSVAFDQYVDSGNDFVFSKPAGWERTEKSGATVLYVDPQRKSTTLGVVVSPVRIQSLEQFGTLTDVSKRLQDAEKNKDGYLDIQVLREVERRAACGAVMYEYVYKLDSSRGLKSIYNVVSITNRKLYIYTLTIKEAKKEEEQAVVQRTKDLADALVASFDIGAKAPAPAPAVGGAGR